MKPGMSEFSLNVISMLLLIFVAVALMLRPDPPLTSYESAAARMTPEEYFNQSDTITDLLLADGIESAFEYVREQNKTNPSFARDCHPLMHNLGHEAFHAADEDFASAITGADEVCNSGFIHGVIQSYFSHFPERTELPQGSCAENQQWDISTWQCFHGIGHGYVLASNRNIDEARIRCEALQNLLQTHSCMNGAYMEMFFLSDHSGNKQTSLEEINIGLCDDAGDYLAECVQYSPTAFLEEHPGSYEYAALKYCLSSRSSYVRTCQFGVGSQAMKDNIANPSIAAEFCRTLAPHPQANCMRGAISSLFFNNSTTEGYVQSCQTYFSDVEEQCLDNGSRLRNGLKF